ncbi:hypothetical protein DFH09DRAFT_1377431 [Mycena vulgaris]|nr:hypothetical protein DFH09DRAFT_1377431 [Mycena vulgaris]
MRPCLLPLRTICPTRGKKHDFVSPGPRQITPSVPTRKSAWNSVLPVPTAPQVKAEQWPSLHSIMHHPLRKERWSREADAFFAFQADFFRDNKANIPALEAMLADMQKRVADLERQVKNSRADRITYQETVAALLLRWEALSIAVEALDAVCWGPLRTKAARDGGEFKDYNEIGLYPLAASERIYVPQQLRAKPIYIANVHRLLLAQRTRLDWRHGILVAEGWTSPAVPVKYFFKLGKELGIPTELQVEMATAEKATGESFFVW